MAEAMCEWSEFAQRVNALAWRAAYPMQWQRAGHHSAPGRHAVTRSPTARATVAVALSASIERLTSAWRIHQAMWWGRSASWRRRCACSIEHRARRDPQRQAARRGVQAFGRLPQPHKA
ncbi:hypothetical protein XFF4834R_chr20460 [Xanthomonas citri pv. fuscans]|nr:hypothetical protein XFF4834R_chr20460 [Xanthomonas citri pv. fuscans]